MIKGKICSPESCKFYYLRRDSTPIEFEGLFEAAMLFRESRLNELTDELNHLWATVPFWAVAAYKAAERAFRIVESETAGKDPSKTNNDLTITRTGSTAFADIEAAKERERSQARGAGDHEAIEKFFETNPDFSESVFDFLEMQINAFP